MTFVRVLGIWISTHKGRLSTLLHIAFSVILLSSTTRNPVVSSLQPQYPSTRRSFNQLQSRSRHRSRSDEVGDRVESTTEALSRRSFLKQVTVSSLLASASTPAIAQAASATRSSPTMSPSTTVIGSSGSKTMQESISGFVAGAALTTIKTFVKYPLDTATVRLQMPETSYSIQRPGALFDGSYRGISSPLLWQVPGGAVFFAVKDATKQSLKQSGLPKWAITCLAVAVAQGPYWLVRNPSEVVKSRQQARVDGYGDASVLEGFQRLWEESKMHNNGNGFYGFYKGYVENILYAYPADVVKFVLYDSLTKGRKDLPPAQGAVAGAIATAIAQLVTTPLDVVRNRIMVVGEKQGEGQDDSDSYLSKLIALGREEGWKGLFAGANPRVGKAFLSGAIQFATYEETKQEIGRLLQR